MQIDINSLNPQQKEAVMTTEGPLLILAGAGSGKTRVLTVRIAYILEQKLARPEEVLAVTFTNKAAKEMKERIAHLLGTQIGLPWMGTFHAICVKILKRDGHNIGLNPNFTIYDPNDQQTLVRQAMDSLNVSVKEVNPRAVLGYISTAKSELISEQEYANFAQGYFQELVAKIYPLYQKLLRENNAVDFDDLLLDVVELFKEEPKVLAKYRALFKYILVDEYQDTNHVQYEMISLLAREHLNICVVGDDDQSIYAFRGATIRNILNFERDYPRAKIIKLEQNYRSTKRILDAAYGVVRKNQKRTDKKLWTENKDGEMITIYTARDEKDEAEWVAQEIQALTNAGVDPEEIAILYRTNAQSRALEERFIRNSLSYRIVGGVRFYDRKEIKDILAYLRILYNPQDDTSLKRVINVPPREIGPSAIKGLAKLSQAKGASFAQTLTEYAEELDNKPLRKFATLLQQIVVMAGKLDVGELINFVLEKTGYIKMLEDGTSENEARIENLKELISVAAKFYDLPPKEGLEAFLEEISLLEGDIGTEEENAPKVTLMTIHAAKGLEFQHVFVVGVEEGLFPHSRVFTEPSELEEERRLAYVAITRAKEQLYLVHADSRMYFGARQQNMVSRFIEDIPEKLVTHVGRSGERRSGWEDISLDDLSDDVQIVEVKAGDRVKHEYFGIGKVITVNDSTVKVNFGPVYGTKELSREFAPLEKV